MIYLQLFLSYLKIGFFGFGGGYAMLALIQNEVVVRHAWMTNTEFTDIVAVSQMTPGPIAINSATYVGYTVGARHDRFGSPAAHVPRLARGRELHRRLELGDLRPLRRRLGPQGQSHPADPSLGRRGHRDLPSFLKRPLKGEHERAAREQQQEERREEGQAQNGQ